MHSHTLKLKPSTSELNQLSYASQKQLVDDAIATINKLLKPTETKELDLTVTLGDLTNHFAQNELKLDSDLIKKKIMQATLNEFMQASAFFLKEIEKKSIPQNNLGILAYFKKVQEIFETCQRLINPLLNPKNDPLAKTLTQLVSFCETHQQQVTKMLDVSIYEVKIPKEKYKNIKKNSETFHYDGRANGTVKTFTGAMCFVQGVPYSIATAVYFGPPALAIAAVSPQRRAGVFNFLKSNINNLFIRRGTEFVSAYGYACKQDFPAQWIVGRVTVQGNQANVVVPNPNFQEQKLSKTVYILDGRRQEYLFEHGTNLFFNGTSGNKYGHVVFFHKPSNAMACAAKRTNGNKYDPVSGWRLYNDWKGEERKFASEYEPKLRKQVNHTLWEVRSVPDVLSDLISDYVFDRPIKSRI